MIGQAGTGSPEAGIVLQRRSPCSCLHLADGGKDKTPRDPEQTRESSLQRTPGILTASTTPVVVIIHWRKKNKFVFAGNRTLSCNFSSPFRAEMRQTF